MNYEDLIRAFEQWLETNYLAKDAQLLWYKIIALFDKAGWPEWIGVDNQRLMASMQIRREATFLKLRDELLEKNFFGFRKGKKAQPNRYKLFTFNFESINSSIKRSTNSSINSSISSSIKRSRNRRHIYITL